MPGPGTYKVYSEFGDVNDYTKKRVHTEGEIKEEKNENNETNANANETTQDNEQNNTTTN